MPRSGFRGRNSVSERTRLAREAAAAAPVDKPDSTTCRAFPFPTTKELLCAMTPKGLRVFPARINDIAMMLCTPKEKGKTRAPPTAAPVEEQATPPLRGRLLPKLGVRAKDETAVAVPTPPAQPADDSPAADVQRHFKKLVMGLPVTCSFVAPFESSRSHPNEDPWIHVADVDVPWGTSLVAVALHWGEQGWGNQKGMVRLCVGHGVRSSEHDKAWSAVIDASPGSKVPAAPETGDLLSRIAPRPAKADLFALHLPENGEMSATTTATNNDDRQACGIVIRSDALGGTAQSDPLPLARDATPAILPPAECAPTALLIAVGGGGGHQLDCRHGAVVLSYLGRDIGAALDRRFLRTLLPHHDEGEEDDHAPHRVPPVDGQGHQAVMQAATAHLTPSARCRIARLAAETGAGSPLPLLVASLCRMRPLLRRYVLEWAFPIPHAALLSAFGHSGC